MITLTSEGKIRHNLVNIITNNQAMVYLKRKNISNAIKDCKLTIYETYRDKKISIEIFNQLLEIVNETFEESSKVESKQITVKE